MFFVSKDKFKAVHLKRSKLQIYLGSNTGFQIHSSTFMGDRKI